MRIIKLLIFLLFFCFWGESIYAKGVQKVVIDAGHGGKDSGTVARSHRHKHEKVIALAIAKKLGKYIQSNYEDVDVIYTRTRDVYLTLNQRAKIANKAEADLFISIHVDAVDSKRVSGASVYVLGLHRSEDNLKVAMRENAVMLQEEDYKTKYAGFDPNDAESYIIFSLMQNQYLNNSMTMASLVDSQLKRNTKRRTKGVKQAGFYVLREVSMPSVLIETGYITNGSDADFLCSKKGQEQTALSIFYAFKQYKDFMEDHTSDLALSRKENIERKNVEKSSQDYSVAEETFFTIQVLYSKKKLKEGNARFKGLSPIFRSEEAAGNRYMFGKTQNYDEAVKMQKKARKFISDAYIIGFHKGKLKKASEIRQILKLKE